MLDPACHTEKLQARLSALASALTELSACGSLIPRPLEMSKVSAAIYWFIALVEYSIYGIVLWGGHTIIHRFAVGRIYVEDSLATLFTIGTSLIVWPFATMIVTDLGGIALRDRGDIPVFVPTYVVDFGPVAVGIFLLAMRVMLKHAIALKYEHDLTI